MLLLAFVIENKSVHFKPSPDIAYVFIFQTARKDFFYVGFRFPCCKEGSKGRISSVGSLLRSPILKILLLLSGKSPVCELTDSAVLYEAHSSGGLWVCLRSFFLSLNHQEFTCSALTCSFKCLGNLCFEASRNQVL